VKTAIKSVGRLDASSSSATNAATDAARKTKRSAKAPNHASQQEELECEWAWYSDAAGQLAGYPCWARGVLGAGNRGGRR
jgi:hypothetical protein